MFVIVIIIYSATQMPKLLQDVLSWDGGNDEGLWPACWESELRS